MGIDAQERHPQSLPCGLQRFLPVSPLFPARTGAEKLSGRVSSAKEIAIEPLAGSFDERFAGAFDWPRSRQTAETEEHPNGIFPLSPDLGGRAAAGRAVDQSARGFRPLATSPLASIPRSQLLAADAPEDMNSLPDADDHIAIYDIAAHTVYLPNGQRLEAHSGLGRHLDDPHYVSKKDRGPTPPNVYDLSLRERLFHGVRAIRLTPVGEANMFGRDGMLAHSYMLGPNGQSNGCVSFSNYPVFLNAFLSGEINRLIVVERLEVMPSPKTASRLPETRTGSNVNIGDRI